MASTRYSIGLRLANLTKELNEIANLCDLWASGGVPRSPKGDTDCLLASVHLQGAVNDITLARAALSKAPSDARRNTRVDPARN